MWHVPRSRSASRTQLALSAGTASLGRSLTHQDYLAELPPVNFDNSHVQRSTGVNASMASKHKQYAKENLWDRKEIPRQISYLEVSEAYPDIPMYSEVLSCASRLEAC